MMLHAQPRICDVAGRRHHPFGLDASGGAGRAYRGSRKRLKRIKFFENTSVEFWLFVVLMLFMLLVVVPWLIKHPPRDHDAAHVGHLRATWVPLQLQESLPQDARLNAADLEFLAVAHGRFVRATKHHADFDN